MRKIFKDSLLTLLFILSIALLVGAKQKHLLLNETVCKSTTVRSLKDYKQLQNCTVVAGHVRLVHMQFSGDLIDQGEFSNIEEITGYLLVYRVEGLASLEVLFPKLIVIRGVELLYDQYALVVMENRELQDIGLVSLLRVLKGSIRVESNPSLCFTDTINWVSILGNTEKNYNYVMKNNKPAIQCPVCFNDQNENDLINEDRYKHCWSVGKFQRYTADYNDGKKCNKQGRSTGNCLTSCSDNNCRHCINYVTDKGCINNCLPPRYNLAYKRQCVSDCSRLGLISFGMECVEKCPKHYRKVTQNDQVTCVINCTGNFKVHTLEDLDGFADCSTILGSLTIELYESNKPIIKHLEEAFRGLTEITGYLRILRSPQITSLNFFQSLHTVRGDNLIENTYSLYIVDNYHLEKLWNTNQEVVILHGRVYFHLNPRLCYSHIMELQKNLKESQKISITDASRNSNGERVVCSDFTRTLSANVTDYNSNSALILHEIFDVEDLNLIIGYIYYYKEAPQRNVTRYDGRHGCGQDEWFMDITQSKQRRHIIKNLKPATQYAYFVKTMTLVDYHYQLEAISEIQYFQTLPAKPGPVAKFYSHSLSTSEIEVFWWPPLQPNGVIAKYILKYEVTNLTMLTNSGSSSQNREQSCMCPKLDAHLSGGTPDEEKYYQKEEVIYTDALYNFILRKDESNSNANLEMDSDIPSNTSMEEIFLMAFDIHQQSAIRTQDHEKESFVIDHPYPICNRSNPKTQYQSENKCLPLDNYEESIQVPAQRHTYTFTDLKSELIYRFSIRACVEDLPNGCGPQKVILAETVSKRMESFLESIKFYKL